MNRFCDIRGDVSMQLSPWELKKLGYKSSESIFELMMQRAGVDRLRFRSDIAGGVIFINDGYRSNLASIPQFAWSIFMRPDDPRIELGAWIHDWIYGNGGNVLLESGLLVKLTREQCDRILAYEAMPELGASSFQCAAVYRAIRMFGGSNFGKT